MRRPDHRDEACFEAGGNMLFRPYGRGRGGGRGQIGLYHRRGCGCGCGFGGGRPVGSAEHQLWDLTLKHDKFQKDIIYGLLTGDGPSMASGSGFASRRYQDDKPRARSRGVYKSYNKGDKSYGRRRRYRCGNRSRSRSPARDDEYDG